MKKNERKIWFIYSSFAVLILVFSFYQNVFGIVTQIEFQNFQLDSEALVLGGLAYSQQYGLRSSPFKLGFTEDANWLKNNNVAWYEGTKINVWRPYVSQIGLQGWIFSVLERLFNTNNAVFIKWLRIGNSFLLAFCFVFLLVWVGQEFGLFQSIVLLVWIVLSPSITLFARNIYWVIWTSYLPMFVAGGMLWMQENRLINRPVVVYVVFFLVVLVKAACGYEYISSVLVSMIVPYFYFAISRDWPKKVFFARAASASLAALFGFFMAIILHIMQTAAVVGTLKEGFFTVWQVAEKRTVALDTRQFAPVFKESLDASHFEVIQRYFSNAVITIPKVITVKSSTMLFLSLVLVLAALIASLYIKDYSRALKLKALSVSVIIGLFGTFSWLFLAKGHSYIHTNINHLLWTIPSSLLFAILLSSLPALVLRYFIPQTTAYVFVSAAVTISLIFFQPIQESLYTYMILQKGIDLTVTDHMPDYGGDRGFTVSISGRNLFYYASIEEGPDLEAPFFLHIFPVNSNELPEYRKIHGYDNLDFIYTDAKINPPFGTRYKSYLIAKRVLPTYWIREIVTGQYIPETGQRLWETKIPVVKH